MLRQELRTLFRQLIPQIFLSYRQNRNIYGNYQSYQNALVASGSFGYVAGSSTLTEYVKSLRDTRDPNKIWAWTSLSAILYSVSSNSSKGEITNIFDYGGGYGETYFQLREWLTGFNVQWNVVKLEDKVAIAKEEGFETENLAFITIADFDRVDWTKIDCILLGGVLQYPEHPYEILENLVKKRPKMIALDRTPLLSDSNGKELYHVQAAPYLLGGSVHPLRILNRQRLESVLKKGGYLNCGEHDYGPFPRSYSKGCYIAQIWKIDSTD